MDLLPCSVVAEFRQSLRGPSRLLDKSLLVKLKCQKTSQSAPGPCGHTSHLSYGAVRLCHPVGLNMFGMSRNSLAQTSGFALGFSFPEINLLLAAPPEVSPAPHQHKDNMAVCPSVG